MELEGRTCIADLGGDVGQAGVRIGSVPIVGEVVVAIADYTGLVEVQVVRHKKRSAADKESGPIAVAEVVVGSILGSCLEVVLNCSRAGAVGSHLGADMASLIGLSVYSYL